MTLVASAMVDEKENQQIAGGLDAIFSGRPVLPQNQQDQEKFKADLGIAYHTVINEVNKNQTLKWKDGSDVVLFGEKVKMFQSTEKQYKNSQMFGYLNYPSFNQYPNSNSTSLDDLGKLNGLDQNSMKYQGELFNIIGNHHKSKPDNIGLLNSKYHQYYNGDRIDPVFWEGILMGGTVNAINKVVGSTLNTGKTVASQTGGYWGNFANKYPNISGAVLDGTVSASTHIAYKVSTGQNLNGYEIGGAFAGGALTRNHTLRNQIRINVGVATVSSLSKDPSGNSLTNDYFGAIASPIIGKAFENKKYGSVFGGYLGEYGGDLDNIKNTIKNFDENLKRGKE